MSAKAVIVPIFSYLCAALRASGIFPLSEDRGTMHLLSILFRATTYFIQQYKNIIAEK